jgi:uncharacterized membrane protein YesL
MDGSRWVLTGKQSQRSGSALGDILERVGGLALANLFWVLLSLPVVTMPAATAGLFAATSPWARGKPGELFRDFFDGMRQCWRKSTLIVVGDLLLGGLVVINLSIFRLMGLPQPLMLMLQSVTLFVGIGTVLVNLYVWPLMVLFDLTIRDLCSAAFQMVFTYPWRSLLILVAALVPVLLGLVLPAAVVIMVSFSVSALWINWATWQVIRRYVADAELVKLETKSPFLVSKQNTRTR